MRSCITSFRPRRLSLKASFSAVRLSSKNPAKMFSPGFLREMTTAWLIGDRVTSIWDGVKLILPRPKFSFMSLKELIIFPHIRELIPFLHIHCIFVQVINLGAFRTRFITDQSFLRIIRRCAVFAWQAGSRKEAGSLRATMCLTLFSAK